MRRSRVIEILQTALHAAEEVQKYVESLETVNAKELQDAAETVEAYQIAIRRLQHEWKLRR